MSTGTVGRQLRVRSGGGGGGESGPGTEGAREGGQDGGKLFDENAFAPAHARRRKFHSEKEEWVLDCSMDER